MLLVALFLLVAGALMTALASPRGQDAGDGARSRRTLALVLLALCLAAYGNVWVGDTGQAGPAALKMSVTQSSWLAADSSQIVAQYSRDWNGDRNNDVLGVAADGGLYLYPGTGYGGFTSSKKIGHGWSGFDKITQFGDVDANGGLDIVAIKSGVMWAYEGDGTGRVKSGIQMGPGWDAYRLIVAPGDWTGDGHDDLLGLRASDDTLWLWPGNGRGRLLSARQIGYGWRAFTGLAGVGDFNGDGANDLTYLSYWDGWLRLYPGDGDGGFAPEGPQFIGHSWDALTAVVGVGDFSGDGRTDVIARTQSGALLLYRGNGYGLFYSGYTQVGHGWSATRILGNNVVVDDI